MQRRGRPNRQPRRGNHIPNPNSSSNSSTPNQSYRNSPRPPRQSPVYVPVPAFSSITAGTGVSIILKQDQPTGHQVQGIVEELLTRGDHPRGVKVRLRDGRVGRVQKVISEDGGSKGEELAGGADAGLGRDGESAGASVSPRGRGGGRGRGGFRHVRDIREDDDYLYDENQSRSLGGYFTGLEALEAADAEDKQRARGANNGELAKCPVCGEFEGDERAVAHHVESHFADT